MLVVTENDDTDEAARATAAVAATIDSFVMMVVLLWVPSTEMHAIATSNCVRTWRQQGDYLPMSGERCNFAYQSKSTADSDTAIITANNEANANLILS